MKTAAIPLSWITMTKGQRFDPKLFLKLYAEINKRGIDHDDLPAVEAVWREIYHGPGPAVVKNWASEIALFRETHQISKAEFARRANMSVSAVSALENGSFKQPRQKEADIRHVLWEPGHEHDQQTTEAAGLLIRHMREVMSGYPALCKAPCC
jgi:hypothetical protein